MNVSSAAQAYAAFGALLAGFAFTGVCLYFTRKPETKRVSGVNNIDVDHIAGTLFYAMTALALSSFLYSNLSGNADPRPDPHNPTAPPESPGAAEAALLPYGGVLALSVLVLFYSVTLMMLEQELGRAARHAYWVLSIAGPVVVLRFLSGSARAAQQAGCHQCDVQGLFSVTGITIMMLIALALSLLVTFVVPHFGPLRWLGSWINRRPTAPAVMVLVATASVTVEGSLYLNTRPTDYGPTDQFIYRFFWAGVAVLALFALAASYVLGPRVQENPFKHWPWGLDRVWARALACACSGWAWLWRWIAARWKDLSRQR
jgi:magnesium-transporting ATPase (P-type)